MKFLDINLPVNLKKELSDSILQISGCSISLESDFPMFELENQRYYLLNSNNNENRIDIEFRFENSPKFTYKKYLIRTIAIRNENGILIKINKGIEQSDFKYYSKVTKEGKTAIGMSYYFNSDEEKNSFLNSKKISIEYCVAFRNLFGYLFGVYDVCCVLSKNDNEWLLEKSNTYRTHKLSCIKSLVH